MPIYPLVLEEKYLKFVDVFSIFRYYLPFEMAVTLHLNKIKSSLSKDALCEVWLKLAQLLWGRFLKFRQCIFSIFRNYLRLETGVALYLKKKLNPLKPRIHCAKIGWNWPSRSGEEDENVKILQTDGRWTTGDHKSSRELSAQLR